MSSHKSIIDFLDDIDNHLSRHFMMKGGTDSTQPYKSYESLLNKMYEYIGFIFVNNQKNHKELSKSIEELDQCNKDKDKLCVKQEEYEDISRTLIPIEEPNTEKTPITGILLRKGEELE